MIINLDEVDLIKATTWREELHKRDASGRFAKQVGQKNIRKGSKVVAKNGATGKVVGSTDTHYHIEKEDGKQSKVLKQNVLHEDEHKELTAKPKAKPKAKGTKKDEKPKKSTGKAVPKPKEPVKGAGRGSTTKPALVVDTSKPKPATKKQSGKKSAEDVKAPPKPKASKVGGTVDAPKKATTKKKTTTKPKTEPTKGAVADAKTKPKGTGKSVQSKAGANTTKGDAKDKPSTAKGRGAKGIRTEVQKNRSLAYDVGDKIGGARKDDFERSFKETPSLANLERLEKDNGALAEKMVTKKNIMPAFSFEEEHKNGTDLQTAILKKLLIDRVAPKPQDNTPEERRAYVESIHKLHRHLAGIKTWDNMRNAVRELSDLGRKGKQGERAVTRMNWLKNNTNATYINEEAYNKDIEAGKQAKAIMDFTPLGDKLENFFSNFESRENAMRTINKNMAEGWDKYLNPVAKAPSSKGKPAKPNQVWEREAVTEAKRTGGKKMTVDKPEELIKNFGVRGVEFGHWVNDSSGKFHLQRCAEAFSDLAEIVGIDDKDISLNGRLAIAFGARGKAGAVAHYEPAKKVINMTKYGGAGSLAHEWGHAMDNILAQYSNGGTESMNMASNGEGELGDHDPKLKLLYEKLMTSIKSPVPGETGAIDKRQVSSADAKTYSPRVVRILQSASSDEEGIKQVIEEWQQADYRKRYQIANMYKSARAEPNKAISKGIEKKMNKAIRERNKAKSELPGNIAYGMYMKNGRKEHWSGTVEIPVGTSNYMHNMSSMDDGNMGKYYSKDVEMFARVFESYIEEKLTKGKRLNNYLVHSTSESHVKALGAPFPTGKERQAMFKDMENLLKHLSSKGTLKKALIMDMLTGERGEELRKSLDGSPTAKRSAFNVASPEEVIYIPVNRLRVVYQTDKATNWDKVTENVERMVAGENLEPIVIGHDYDIHDGHHRYEASKLANYEHVPCVVKGGNEIERQRAVESYKELWKAIVPDPVADDAFEEDSRFMFRGVGQKELDFIQKNGYIQTKGKGNDDDKGDSTTCFSNLYSQAVGYAKTNYDLYNEKQAYVVALPKAGVTEDEHGELVAKGKVPADNMRVIPIPKEGR